LTTIRTERLVMRPWTASDRAPFAALNADPEVMRWFPATLDRDASDAFADRVAAELDERGYGLWAVEVVGGAPFVGYVGLHPATFEAPFTPALEVGWRLAKEHWGRGYAPEAARAALDHAFERLGVDEVVSFTAVGNDKSRRVMEKIGMTRDPAEDFDHPNVAADSPIRRHVLYRLAAPKRTNRPGRAPVGSPSS
jgi:RimJ/RimL family protein N-acetyltransferase